MDPIEFEKLKEAFHGRYFPREKRECKVEGFIILRKVNMSLNEYSLRFTQFSCIPLFGVKSNPGYISM